MTLLAFLTPEHQAFLLAMALFAPFLLFVYWYVSRDKDEIDLFSKEHRTPVADAKKTVEPTRGTEKLSSSASSGAVAVPQTTAQKTAAAEKPRCKKPPANKSKKKKRR